MKELESFIARLESHPTTAMVNNQKGEEVQQEAEVLDF